MIRGIVFWGVLLLLVSLLAICVHLEHSRVRLAKAVSRLPLVATGAEEELLSLTNSMCDVNKSIAIGDFTGSGVGQSLLTSLNPSCTDKSVKTTFMCHGDETDLVWVQSEKDARHGPYIAPLVLGPRDVIRKVAPTQSVRDVGATLSLWRV